MHTVLDHDGHIPAFATVTGAKTHESHIAQLELPKGSINYSWFGASGERTFFRDQAQAQCRV